MAQWTKEELKLKALVLGGQAVVVNIKGARHARIIAWAKSEGRYHYIGRPSIWGNPHPMRDHSTRERLRVIAGFERDLDPDLAKRAAEELPGTILGCYCAPKKCHGHVLARIANAAS